MTTDSLTDRQHASELLHDWRPPAELAPSEVKADEAWLIRGVGFAGLLFLVAGAATMLALLAGKNPILGSTLGFVCLLFGTALVLFHAASDHDPQIRRMYVGCGYVALFVGIGCSFAYYKDSLGELFLPWGVLSFFVGLLFLLSAGRLESDPAWKDVISWTLVVFGAAMALVGLGFGNKTLEFLLPRGLVASLLGLCFLWGVVALRGGDDSLGFRSGLALGVLGGVCFLVALVRSFLDPRGFLMPSGLVLGAVSLLYLGISLGICSDNRLVVLTRRELASFFYSPIAYIVFFGMTFIAWQLFGAFVFQVLWRPGFGFAMGTPNPVTEPIVANYIIEWFPIICVIFLVPVLTMRLLAEEHRTGTLEVLLTAPLDEATIVISKFIAAWLFYLLLWAPWGLFLTALRYEGGTPFDYRPMLGFYVALAVTGAGFLGMGIFFSSLTKNQIAAAVLTFVGMLGLTYVYFAKRNLLSEGFLSVALTHISYIDLWINAIQGKIHVRDLFYHATAAVFWLFLTVKVLESRKWG
jgi:ABC-type transport system involved in multi-copper enzyme maturation permease subunit